MKKLTFIAALFLFSCTEEITPVPVTGSNVLEITSNKYTEVKIDGFGSVWVDGSFTILLSRGTYSFHACGYDGEIVHDGKNKLVVECQ